MISRILRTGVISSAGATTSQGLINVKGEVILFSLLLFCAKHFQRTNYHQTEGNLHYSFMGLAFVDFKE